jgi:hypothetical protein
MKKIYLTINYKAKVQVLEGGNADEVLENVVINPVDADVFIVDSQLDEGTVNVIKDQPDFFLLDTRMKVVLEYTKGDLEDIVEGGIEFDVDGMFVAWDYEVYGWAIDDVK